MTRRLSRRSTVNVRSGVLGLMLGVPLLAGPVLAQDAPTVGDAEDPVVETVIPDEQPRVLISEVLIEGLSGHPEEERLQIAAYEAMSVRPGNRVTRDELQRDLNAIQATGWFSDARITPVDGPLGVQLVVQVEPFPKLTKVIFDPVSEDLPESVIEETFASDYGRTLNLRNLQQQPVPPLALGGSIATQHAKGAIR